VIYPFKLAFPLVVSLLDLTVCPAESLYWWMASHVPQLTVWLSLRPLHFPCSDSQLKLSCRVAMQLILSVSLWKKKREGRGGGGVKRNPTLSFEIWKRSVVPSLCPSRGRELPVHYKGSINLTTCPLHTKPGPAHCPSHPIMCD